MFNRIRIIDIVWIFAFATLCGGKSEALDLSKSLSQYVHQSYGLESGLPQISAMSLAQTTDGYIWVGTQEGLSRFDGIDFVTFSSENTPAFQDDHIVALAADRKNDGLWIASHTGNLVHYEAGEFRVIEMSEDLKGQRIMTLALDDQGKLWIGIPAGLAHVVDGQVRKAPGNRETGQVNVILVMPSGELILGAQEGLFLFSQGEYLKLSYLDDAPTSPVRSMCLGASKVAWIGTDTGVYGYANGRFSDRSLGSLGPQRIDALIEDRNGNLWIGTESQGVHILRGENLSSYPDLDPRGRVQVAALLEDKERNIWIGTQDQGLQVLSDGLMTVFSWEEGLPSRTSLGVVDDALGNLWVGSPMGLSRISPSGKVRVYGKADGLPSDFVMSLTFDVNGGLWVGTRNAGLARFTLDEREGQGIRLIKDQHWSTAQGLQSDAIYGVHEDRDGVLWVGTNGGGLHRIKDGEVSHYSAKEGLSNNKVTAIVRDPKGDLWVGTDYGLDKFEGADFSQHSKVKGLEGLSIMSLYLDQVDNLWISTYGKGLRLIRENKIHEISRKDGLFDNVIYVIVPDSQGNLWMTGNKGLAKTSRHALLDFVDGKTDRIECEVYGSADGMRSREGIGGFMTPGWATQEGILWFSTVNGVIRVDPTLERGQEHPPLMSIEASKADGSPFEPGSTLPPGVGLVEFKYTGLAFYAPERMEFEYRLKGFEQEWNHAGRRRNAFYTNLPPGKYTFEVMAKSAGGTVSKQPATLSFQVKPAFYQTAWFYVLLAIGLGLLVVLLLRIRTIQVKRREVMTSKLAWQKAQAVLETQVDAIRSLGEVLGNAIERMNTHMNDLAQAASEVALVVSESEEAVREVGEAGMSVQADADRIVSEVRRSEKVSSSGRITMLETVAAIDRMREDATEVTRSSSNLLDSLAQVDRTIASVKEIAEKSKILAINASIEAVKAGRAGAGFAVVAREIKAMAQQSKGATAQITALLNMVRSAIAEITVIGERSQKRTVAGVEMLSRSQDTVNTFNDAMGHNLQLAHSIAKAVKENGSRLQLVLEAFTYIATAAEVNKEVSQEMTAEATKLRQIAGGLTNLIESWKSPEFHR
jgi:ligand-binding sensor domain-containing protein/methyl-accepting chemotaxis protein